MSEKNTCQNRQNDEKPTCPNYGDALFSSREDMNTSISKLLTGNLLVLGKIWIHTLKVFLLGFQCPIVACAPKNLPKCGEKRLTELSSYIYDCAPEKDKHVSVLHNLLLPYVRKARENCQSIIEISRKEVSNKIDEANNDAVGERILSYFIDDDNYYQRVQIVACGGMLGFLKPGGLPTRMFFTACGLGATGMLCFPKETDEMIRAIMSHTGNMVTGGYDYITEITGKKPRDEMDCEDICKCYKGK